MSRLVHALRRREIEESEKDARESFFRAVEKDDTCTVKELASKFINSTDEYRMDALHLASEKNSIESVKVLLKAGYNPNRRDLDDETPLHKAAQKGNHRICELLIKHKSDVNMVNTPRNATPLHLAVINLCNGNTRERRLCIKTLLENEADTEIIDSWECTPLQTACSHQCCGKVYGDLVRMLLAHGADPNSSIDVGETPLFRAVVEGNNPFAVQALLEMPTIDTSGLVLDEILKREKIQKIFYEHHILKLANNFYEFCKKGNSKHKSHHASVGIEEIRKIMFKQLLLSSEFPMTDHWLLKPLEPATESDASGE